MAIINLNSQGEKKAHFVCLDNWINFSLMVCQSLDILLHEQQTSKVF